MKIIAVIPARLQSTRFPRKILADIQGKPMLWHVWNRTKKAKDLYDVFVATDSDEVFSIVTEWGGKAIMTNPECASGTERIASIIDQLDADWVFNVQGDEPFISFNMIDQMVHECQQDKADLITAVYPLSNNDDLLNPNIVKVVRTKNGLALYFSRSPIPYARDTSPDGWLQNGVYWGHIGIYAYRREILTHYNDLLPGSLEAVEKLEQLRFLEAGMQFQTIVTQYRSIAVDTPADLEVVRKLAAQGDYYEYST
ncbi:MAG: 3-deoxy-manno-octulosonate cytidylyltransferase [Anaerolineaceae bacterium]|nr:3-deoxy-manno-octulosonate cytidylyltransferase [Anaerolineaceae bacterium]